MLCLPRKLRRQAVDETLHRELLEVGRDGAGVETADIEKGIQQVGHCRQRMFLVSEHLEGPFIRDRTAQRAVQQTERLHRLPQIVTRRRQECAVGLVRSLGLLPCCNDVLLHSPALGHIADDARHKCRGSGRYRAEADLDGKLGAVLAASDKIQTLTHRSNGRLLRIFGAVRDMFLTHMLRQKYLDRLPEKRLAVIAK